MKSTFFALALALPTAAAAQSYPDAQAIVAIGGPVTETIFALGEGARVIARDTTSLYPEAVTALPDVGYMRQLSAEGVLSVGPDLIVTRDTAGPPETLDQLRAASIPVVSIHDSFTKEAVLDNVTAIGAAIGAEEAAATLHATIATQFVNLEASLAKQTERPRILFILSNQAGRLNVAGAQTGANGIIEMAGGENVMAAAFDGYKIMGDEALIEAAPDVVVMMTGEADHEGRADEIFALPALAQSPAAAHGRFVQIDPAAMGFGPRTALFAQNLHDALVETPSPSKAAD
ncbi:ABC transporter substrate-binding protein [Celeribacter baekdonensis]|uniref:heme/hemin ABC transporter substrate-binding protein n=1 Tax=Celeribacter baekdonensis TaxID=875171 RepID=UPI0030DBE27A|tara:strand:+ start:114568 stop:115434 length:867 start_codon:yes stop_codon:yes gene_type:complete